MKVLNSKKLILINNKPLTQQFFHLSLTLRVNCGSLWESSKFQITVALRYIILVLHKKNNIIFKLKYV